MPGDFPDPSIVRDGRDYYMTCSSGRYSPGLPIWRSTDLTNWEAVGFALGERNCDTAAPELIKYGELFYIYYPAHRSNWVTTAASPSGPWSEPIDLKAKGIDPGHIATPEGERFLYFSGGYAAPLAPDGLSLLEKPRKVYSGWNYDDSYNVEGFFLESPKLFHRGDYYYLISAQGGTAGPSTAHMAVVARSRAPLGPWENSPYNPLVHTFKREEKWWAKGHGTAIEALDGSWRIVYHAYESGFMTLGRRTLVEALEWTADGWPRIASDAKEDAERPGKQSSPGFSLSDPLRSPRLGYQWQFFGDYEVSRIDFGERGLSMRGKGRGPGDSSPLTCAVGDHSYEATVKVEVEGTASAGLLLFYDPDHFCGLGIDSKGLALFKQGRAYFRLPLESASAYLRIENLKHDIIPSFSKDGITWRKCGFCFETSGYNHNALGGYYSLRVGLFTAGNGLAHFSDFAYRKID